MSMQKKKIKIISILLSLIIIIAIFLIINVVRLFSKPTETTLVKNGTLTKYEEVTGYIIRSEELVDTSGYSGVMQTKVEDSTRIRKNGVIATYVSESEEQLVNKINELDKQIDEAMASQQTIYSPDAKALESNIQIQIYDSIRDNNLYLEDVKKEFNKQFGNGEDVFDTVLTRKTVQPDGVFQ